MGKIVGFLVGPIGKWILLSAAITAWTIGNRIDAARIATSDCQLGVLTATIREERQKVLVAEIIADAAKLRAEEAQTELLELEGLTREILSEKGDGCSVPDNLRERLLRIK